jgi:hypothetical protein
MERTQIGLAVEQSIYNVRRATAHRSPGAGAGSPRRLSENRLIYCGPAVKPAAAFGEDARWARGVDPAGIVTAPIPGATSHQVVVVTPIDPKRKKPRNVRGFRNWVAGTLRQGLLNHDVGRARSLGALFDVEGD